MYNMWMLQLIVNVYVLREYNIIIKNKIKKKPYKHRQSKHNQVLPEWEDMYSDHLI